MHLLDAVESLVGQFDTWPTYMLKILFCEDPAYDQLKRYAAFCYGNGVQSAGACNCTTPVTTNAPSPLLSCSENYIMYGSGQVINCI